MTTLFKIATAAAIAGTLGFAGGAVTAVVRGWGSPLVEVVVENQSGSMIRLVNLQLSSCGGTSSLSMQSLAPGRTHTFRFSVCGEGGYTIDALLENKMVLSSDAYVESGYRIVEHIEPDRIRSFSQVHHF